jgi:serine-type D-Ala-D-Ala carboxypeptidase
VATELLNVSTHRRGMKRLPAAVLLLFAATACTSPESTLTERVEQQLLSLDLRERLAQLIVVGPGESASLDDGRVAVGGVSVLRGAALTTPSQQGQRVLLRPMVVDEVSLPDQAMAGASPGALREMTTNAVKAAVADGIDLAILRMPGVAFAGEQRTEREPLADRLQPVFASLLDAGPLLAMEILADRNPGELLPWDLARIHAREGAIIASAARAGVAAMVQAPLRIPSITGDSLPLPHSPAAQTFLRRDHGWDGVVAVRFPSSARRSGAGDTLDRGDAEELEGANAGDQAGEVDPSAWAVRALAAGVDLLLIPPSAQALLDSLEAAVVDGRLAAPRVNEAARRVLRLKAMAEQRRHASPVSSSAVLPGSPVRQLPRHSSPQVTSLASPAADAGMDEAALGRADAAIERALGDSLFTAAALAVSRNGRVVRMRGYGQNAMGASVSADNTLFDLASLTKVVATTTAVAILVERGKMALDAPVQRFVPGFEGEGKEAVTILHLLTHTSGIPSGLWLYGSARSPEEALQQVLRQRLRREPGERVEYSDLGMILLAEAAAIAAGEPLDRFLARELFAPLGMESTMFLPPAVFRQQVVPTALRNERGFVLHGLVHDANAFRLGGVAGHAGLFSTARDLVAFGEMMLRGGSFGQAQVMTPQTVQRFVRRQPGADTRALGWDTPSDRSSAGRYFSTRSFGHTGYTGTSLWIDPQISLVVVLLTNRTYDSGTPADILALRMAVHDAVAGAIRDPEVPRRPGSR